MACFSGFVVCEVHSLLKNRAESGRLMLLGKSVCAAAWRRLLGIGSGRFEKLRKASTADEPPPVDGRFVTRKKLRASVKRARIVEFLEELYHTAAEPMPTLASRGAAPPEDTAEQAVSREQEARPPPGGKKMLFRRSRGRRPKLFRRRDMRKRQKLNNQLLRMLPPGSFSEYRDLFHAKQAAKYPDPVKVTLKTFNNDTRPGIGRKAFKFLV